MKYWIRSQYQGPRGGLRAGLPVSSKRYDTYQEAMDECRKLASCFHACVERAPKARTSEQAQPVAVAEVES